MRKASDTRLSLYTRPFLMPLSPDTVKTVRLFFLRWTHILCAWTEHSRDKAKLGAKNETESRKIPDTRSDYEQMRCEGLLCVLTHLICGQCVPPTESARLSQNSLPVSYKRGWRSRMSENTVVKINTYLFRARKTMSLIQKIRENTEKERRKSTLMQQLSSVFPKQDPPRLPAQTGTT